MLFQRDSFKEKNIYYAKEIVLSQRTYILCQRDRFKQKNIIVYVIRAFGHRDNNVVQVAALHVQPRTTFFCLEKKPN